MTCRLLALSIDANDPSALSDFWSGVLRRTQADDGLTLLPSNEVEIAIRFVSTRRPKTGPNQMHLDLTSSSLEDQRQTVARALALGARHHDVGQRPEEGHVVLADPEGNEFCVIEPGNGFLAGCGPVGALSSDGTQAVGYFWSQALGWPLVWDQDEETAIQSPRGGTKITWGGPPVAPKTGPNRWRLDLAPPHDGDRQAEVDRLLALGATRVASGQDDAAWTVLADPDGNELSLHDPSAGRD